MSKFKVRLISLSHRSKQGSALIIVLLFVILLTGIVLAYLARTMTAMQVSSASANETKAGVMANTAMDIIIGDLKQEIIAGSTVQPVGPAALPTTTKNDVVYVPTSSLTMIPFQNGAPPTSTVVAGSWVNATPTNPPTGTIYPIPNLISRSVSPTNTTGTNPYVPYPISGSSPLYKAALIPPNRAAQDPSAANGFPFPFAPASVTSVVSSSRPSLNNRYISPSDWNAHYLIPRINSDQGTTSTDGTPIASFVPPDWVIVTRAGATSINGQTGGLFNATTATAINNPTPTNTNYAVGRYAYAIYNEGGTLDMNVAGYPSTLPSSLSSLKNSLALADLSQLTVGGNAMTANQIDNIVGWRNYATGTPTGSFSNFSFNGKAPANWLTNFVMGGQNNPLGNTNGFLQVTAAAGNPAQTDQAFISRQQLISLFQSLAISPDYLQYMGTFSRALEQPSFTPDVNKPLILGPNNAPPAANNLNAYFGNNDAVNADASNNPSSSGIPKPVNPAFLSVRVMNPFTRFNGTAAVVGEPLVKYKFALSRLAMVAYNSYNSNLPAGFAPTGADPDPIFDRFGLTRGSTTSPWTYNHNGTTGSSTPANHILTLAEVAALTPAREPDFAELLKAAIVAGSLAKAAPNTAESTSGSNNYPYSQDSLVDIQVLQIMANLIDQQDSDSYPTNIQFTDIATNQIAQIYGAEDLPYFYRFHMMSVVDTQPQPLESKSASATFNISVLTPVTITPLGTGGNPATAGTLIPSGNSTTAPPPPVATYSQASDGSQVTIPNITQETAAQIANPFIPGQATVLMVPDVWNPYDPNSLLLANQAQLGLRPTQFRIYYTTSDPAGIVPASEEEVGLEMQYHIPPSGTAISPAGAAFEKFLPESNFYITPKVNPPTIYWWPISTVVNNGSPFASYSAPGAKTNNTLYFSDISPGVGSYDLFREPTLLWNNNDPSGINLSNTNNIQVKEAATGRTYYGLIFGRAPISTLLTVSGAKFTPPAPNPNGPYVAQTSIMNPMYYYPTPSTQQTQLSFFLQYQDPSGNWVTYDTKYGDPTHGMSAPTPIVAPADFSSNSSWENPTLNGQWGGNVTCMDPRTDRWGMSDAATIGNDGGNSRTSAPVSIKLPPFIETSMQGYLDWGFSTSAVLNQNLPNFAILQTNRPVPDAGEKSDYSNPCNIGLANDNGQMRFFSSNEFSATAPATNSAHECDGMFEENDSSVSSIVLSLNNAAPAGQNYYEDADGVDRLGMAAYMTKTDLLADADSASPIGLPTATANLYTDSSGKGIPTSQSQSRPVMLNRPFQSVAEMSYAFRGTPWKNIDFFTPESGDSALLDTFCLTDPPPSGLVAGKVDLNTRQIPVLQAMMSGAYRDVIDTATSPPAYALPPITSTEAQYVADKLVDITTDPFLPNNGTDTWRGPLENVASLVGHFVYPIPATTNAPDEYTYTAPAAIASTGQTALSSGFQPTGAASVTYAGLSAALDNSVYTNTTPTANPANLTTYKIQRMREAALRPLAAMGQVRVWNLLVDVVAQTGRYPTSATDLSQFIVTGQKHVWMHVAIDRLTGQVLDKQVEAVNP